MKCLQEVRLTMSRNGNALLFTVEIKQDNVFLLTSNTICVTQVGIVLTIKNRFDRHASQIDTEYCYLFENVHNHGNSTYRMDVSAMTYFWGTLSLKLPGCKQWDMNLSLSNSQYY